MKFLLKAVAMLTVVLAGLGGGTVNTSVPGWVSFQGAEASPYRRSVRRTSRRTSRRVSRRHSGYGYGYGYGYGGAAVVGAAVVGAVVVGSVVATLPPACSQVVVNGVVYQNCDSVYYVPTGGQYIVVDEPY